MKILLRDRNPAMVDAWKQEFKDEPDVEVSLGDIFELKADAIVSPANSFGWMFGGIDGVYSRRWPDIQKTLRDHLAEHHYGELPVGLATIVSTGDKELPWLISAPTMRVSSSIRGTVNAYLAFRAALAAVCRHNRAGQDDQINIVLCPGMGTAVGMMDCHIAARQMKHAYGLVAKRDIALIPVDPGQMYDNHTKLIGDHPKLPAPAQTLPSPAPTVAQAEPPPAEPAAPAAPAYAAPEAAGGIVSPPTKGKPGQKPARQVGKAKVTKAKAKVKKAAKVSVKDKLKGKKSKSKKR